ncbi:MAG: ATP-binding cassette domain-containing protein [Planctomycetota bacterium]
MRILTLSEVGFTWRKPALLDNINLAIDKGERIGLLGRNGTGKSTLMKILAGEVQPDHGQIRREPQTRIARLIQEVHTDQLLNDKGQPVTIREIALRGWRATIDDQQSQNTASRNSVSHETASHGEDWQSTAALDQVLSRMQLDGDLDFNSLSAGMKRRALLAQAIISNPDLLLLDEPTNHLDIDSILWLENFLKGFTGALLFVTHDRVFLQALATRILEIDRGRLFDWECGYSNFLERKAAALAAEEKQNELFDKRLAEEEVWIRKGIEARRTRNEGRVRALEAMRRQRSERREKVGNVKMQASVQEKSGQLVTDVQQVSFAYGERVILKPFSTKIMRGDKIGIVGPNGAGKSTLLKVILGQLPPTSGIVRTGTKLEVLYFDQLREQIDGEKTIAENVADGNERLLIGGQERHIYGYLQDFLFTPDRARQPAKFLSGGERNRLLLARLFRKPSNVLVLDEPTNDLDTETLELLEELVSSYEGTLLLVSHDRAFLNNVVTSILALDGQGNVIELGGGYDDYHRYRLRQQEQAEAARSATTGNAAKANSAKANAVSEARPKKSTQKLSFKEQRELEQLPDRIAQNEATQADLHAQMSSPDFFKQSPDTIKQVTEQLSELEQQLTGLYERWEELETRTTST